MSGRRSFSRVRIPGKTELVQHESTYEAQLIDVSLLGALVASSHTIRFKPGSSCQLHFQPEDSSVGTLVFECEIAHVSHDKIGLKFITVDIATINHLRGLLEATTGNKNAIDQEMSRWLNQD